MITCNLSRILGERRMTRKELSEKTGIAMYTLAQLYYDKWKGVNRDTIDSICTVLSIRVGDLIELKKDDEGGYIDRWKR